MHFARFTEGFVDLPERERKFAKNSPQQGKKLMNLHNNEVGRRVSHTHTHALGRETP